MNVDAAAGAAEIHGVNQDGGRSVAQEKQSHHAQRCARGLLLPCHEEAKVLSGDDVVGRHAEEEDRTDKREGEGEEARAGEEQEGPHVTVGKTDVVILQVRLYFKF